MTIKKEIKKVVSLSQMKEATETFCGEIYENDRSFILSHKGKYRSGLSFILPKMYGEEYFKQNGSFRDPIKLEPSDSYIKNMNVKFDGTISFMFGKFWSSPKGTPCFAPKEPAQATHLLLCVDWGGAFNSSRGYFGISPIKYYEGVEYYRSASSNGGGVGYDYWVVDINFTGRKKGNLVDSEEIPEYMLPEDAPVYANPGTAAWVKKWQEEINSRKAEFFRKKEEENVKIKVAMRDKEKCLEILNECVEAIHEFKKSVPEEYKKYSFYIPNVEPADDEYNFKYKWDRHPYDLEFVTSTVKVEVEQALKNARSELVRYIATDKIKDELIPAFEQQGKIAESIGLYYKLSKDDGFYISTEEDCPWTKSKTFAISATELEKAKVYITSESDKLARAKFEARNTKRVLNCLNKTELPEDMRVVFSMTTEATDSEIIEIANSMIKVAKEHGPVVVNWLHELCHCGITRRTDAIITTIASEMSCSEQETEILINNILRLDQNSTRCIADFLSGRYGEDL